jgi:hypothetical protein
MEEKRLYKVGILEGSHHDTEYFEDYEEAEESALANCIDDSFWGIWDDKTDHLEAIAYHGEVYSQ